ncbi:hypothetical protein DRE_02900 [Drechslerella stenobrocha 248]|uniref:Uncharacterized protein n=1 Tax=Drechslerella stenobrocha 248 TaxID=1043628 RepID=W7IF51_9PEZI|nr:hypothetical protein DRE_02900 [Drechslerella stenobrocha 248]
MANKNNPNRPSGSKSKARPRTKPSQTVKRISKSSAAANTDLSSKKSRKLLRNKAYVAQRILEEAANQGEDILMKDEIISRRKEKLLKNLQTNKSTKEHNEAEMDVSEDL